MPALVLAALCCLLAPSTRAQMPPGALRRASAVAVDSAGNLFVADAAAHQVVKTTLGGQKILIAGVGVQGFAGDGGQATGAELNAPQGLAFTADGTLLIADTGNHRIRAVSPGGLISTFAGTGQTAFAGDGGAPSTMAMDHPTALAVTAQGALLICDTNHHRIRRVWNGVVSTVAGSGGQGFSGDGGLATAAELDSPNGIAVAGDGRIFLSDTRNARVRVVGPDGVIRTVAGTGIPGFQGDGGPAVAAELSRPEGLALDASGTMYIADPGNQRVRRLDTTGGISTVAGSGIEGSSADGWGSLSAALRNPGAVAINSFGQVVLADGLNGTLRVISGQAALYQPAALVQDPRGASLAAQTNVQTVYGQGMLPAAVTGPAGTPQGTVVAMEGTQTRSSATLTGGNTALDLTGLDAGVHSLSLVYGGDGLNAAARLDRVAVTVQPAPVKAHVGSLSVAYGQPLPDESGTLQGVLPRDQAQVQLVVSAGTGSGSFPTAGAYPLTTALSGPAAANYTLAAGGGSGQLTVTRATTAVQLSADSGGYSGVPLTLSVKVSPEFQGQPGGTVQFVDGGTVVASAPVQNGAAQAVYAAPAAGSHSMSAVYAGDQNFLPSTSAPAVIVTGAMPDFTIASSSSVATAVAGQAASFTMTVASQPGPFTGSVLFSVTGLPAGASAIFSPPAVVPGASTATVTMTVQTAAQSAARSVRKSYGVQWALALPLLGLFRRRSRRKTALLMAALWLAGCGARTVQEAGQGLLAKTYSVQATGTSTNLAGAVVSHTVPLTLTVQGGG